MHRYIDSDKFHRKLYAIKALSPDGFLWVRRGEVADIAEKLSTADVQEVKHGEWKFGNFGNIDCSNCGFSYDIECEKYLMAFPDGVKELKYCPFCGAKMEG